MVFLKIGPARRRPWGRPLSGSHEENTTTSFNGPKEMRGKEVNREKAGKITENPFFYCIQEDSLNDVEK